jgi:predicted ArsR family transcriptional regulator
MMRLPKMQEQSDQESLSKKLHISEMAATKMLASMRNAEGYMTEVNMLRDGGIEILEHNCPMSSLAYKYPAACESDRAMCGSLLRVKAESVCVSPTGTKGCRLRMLPA